MKNGPSIRAVCRIINRNSCGSGSIVGIKSDGRAIILTNAHVAGTQIGRIVKVYVESKDEVVDARVVMAAHSQKTLADWCVLVTVNPYNKVKPVKLSKNRPKGSHYTKGFPRCRPHDGTDVRTTHLSPNSALWRWRPNSISGQSGSGVWSDVDNLQYGLLTWSWGGDGAGQMTSEIYRQARDRSVSGEPRPAGLVEVNTNQEFDSSEFDDSIINDDPIAEEGFFQESSIADLPIWAEDDIVDPGQPDPDDPVDPNPPSEGDDEDIKYLKAQVLELRKENNRIKTQLAEYLRDQEALNANWRRKVAGEASKFDII